MGIEIYKSLERAIERACREEATRMVDKELSFYANALSGLRGSMEDRRVHREFRERAIIERTLNFQNGVTNTVLDGATAHIRKILNGEES